MIFFYLITAASLRLLHGRVEAWQDCAALGLCARLCHHQAVAWFEAIVIHDSMIVVSCVILLAGSHFFRRCVSARAQETLRALGTHSCMRSRLVAGKHKSS